MKTVLPPKRVAELFAFVDRQVQVQGCDHTMRFASRWADDHQIEWQDLRDAFDQASAETRMKHGAIQIVKDPLSLHADLRIDSL